MKNVLAKICISVCAVACVLTAACAGTDKTGGKSTLLGKPESPTSLTSQENSDTGLKSLRQKADGFAAAFTAAAYEDYKDGGNFAVSPASVFSALSLAAECAAGDTRTEILSALGVTYEDLQNDYAKLFRSLNEEYTSRDEKQIVSKIQLTNSIWVDVAASAKQQCIDALAKNYYCYSYSADFGNDNAAANRAVRAFVKDKTNGLIDNDFKLSPYTLFTLINTLYLKDMWNDGGRDLLFTDSEYSFTASNGTVKKTKLLTGNYCAGKPYSGENFTSFYTRTKYGYKLKFIVPNEGYALSDVFTEENIAQVNAITDYDSYNAESEKTNVTRCFFPEYKAEYNEDITKILKAMGIKALFDENKCNFSTLSDDGLVCSQVRHVTKLAVDKKGVEGAAVTIISMDGATAPNFEYFDFTVDRAFGFILTDSKGVQLFSGAVNAI